MRFAWSERRRLRRALVFALVVAVGIPAVAAAQSPSSSEIERELREAEDEASRAAGDLDQVQARIDAAEVELAEIGIRLEEARGQLIAAEGQVALAEAAMDEAQVEQEVARQDHERAVDALDQAETQLLAEEATLSTQLVESFKHGTAGATRGAMMLEIMRRADDPNEFAVGMKQLRLVMDVQNATVKRVFELRADRSELADDAARARGRATQAAADAEQTLRVLADLREQAAALTTQVGADEQRQREVLASLQQTEDQTAAFLQRVSSREDTLREQLRDVRAEEAAAAAAAAATAAADTGGSGKPGAAGGPLLDGIPCPVVGAVAGRDLQNDWGFPRSGGRFHQGNDIFASRRTPIVAVDDGHVIRWNPPSRPTGLGGITITYRTADGSEWYNAHLDTIADGLSVGASVTRGQIIGTVGNTGNARMTPPHLHLGRRYAGSWVNPWQTVAPACG